MLSLTLPQNTNRFAPFIRKGPTNFVFYIWRRFSPELIFDIIHDMKLQDDSKAYAIMACAFKVHSILKDGFLESAYGDALEIEFKKTGIPYIREDPVRIYYDGQELPTRYRADFTCYNRQYLVELKAIKTLTKVEWAQVIHYLYATQIPYALLINFGQGRLQYETFDLASLS